MTSSSKENMIKCHNNAMSVESKRQHSSAHYIAEQMKWQE